MMDDLSKIITTAISAAGVAGVVAGYMHKNAKREIKDEIMADLKETELEPIKDQLKEISDNMIRLDERSSSMRETMTEKIERLTDEVKTSRQEAKADIEMLMNAFARKSE